MLSDSSDFWGFVYRTRIAAHGNAGRDERRQIVTSPGGGLKRMESE
jgi:hypothetical protein